MELKQYWNLIWKWKWLIIVGIVLAAGTAYVVSRTMTPIYQATTQLLVTPGAPQSSDSYASLVASERLAQTYAELLQSEPLVLETYQRLGLAPMPGSEAPDEVAGWSLPPMLDSFRPLLRTALAWMGLPQPTKAAEGDQPVEMEIAADPIRDTQLITLRVEGTDRRLITAAANALVEVFVEWQEEVQQSRYTESKANLAAAMERLQADIDKTESAIQALEGQGDAANQTHLTRLQDQLAQYRNSYTALLNSYANINLAEANAGATVTVVSQAELPKLPIRPRTMTNTVLAAVVGGLLALGVVFLVEYLDDTVKTQNDLHAADLNLLAVVQRVGRAGRNGDVGLYALTDPRSIVSESFRTLRTNLQFSSPDRPLRCLAVTSALAAEGKTTTSANLAIVLAQDGKRVVLVDADLRRPNIHRLFGLPNRTGLSKALVDDPAALNGYVRNTEVDNLRVLTAGPIPPNPQEMLGSQRMADLLHRLREQADVVVVDTPPVLAVADASVVAARIDGVLLVVHTGQTRQAALQQAVEELRKVGAHLVGGVLNMVPTRKVGGYYNQYCYYYSDYRQDQDREAKRGESDRSGTERRRTGSRGRRAEPVETRG